VDAITALDRVCSLRFFPHPGKMESKGELAKVLTKK
jgi:hypothetical protein